ncbi:RDD family protein [Calothrix sp. 336/3]|uniref:RDD family protein n=1 Tax=Calothrix sp. 336/3 TaxID=1337936 RepID=UPI0004E2C923|nr:RDD family protein [Calothrix sp. 336/3]AKG22790.1 RDD domain-containing protein [Calothrix sp. 336/3]
MTIEPIPQKKYPRVQIGRRAMALGIDFLGTWLLSSLLATGDVGIQFLQILVFIFAWLGFRVLLVYSNQGQSLGKWAFDIKVLESERGRVPDLPTLLKREAIVGASALLVAIAWNNILRNPTAILLMLPLAIDCGAAVSDTQFRQALHDRYAGTMIVSSRRGYSLDIKVKRLVETWRRNVRR